MFCFVEILGLLLKQSADCFNQIPWGFRTNYRPTVFKTSWLEWRSLNSNSLTHPCWICFCPQFLEEPKEKRIRWFMRIPIILFRVNPSCPPEKHPPKKVAEANLQTLSPCRWSVDGYIPSGWDLLWFLVAINKWGPGPNLLAQRYKFERFFRQELNHHTVAMVFEMI